MISATGVEYCPAPAPVTAWIWRQNNCLILTVIHSSPFGHTNEMQILHISVQSTIISIEQCGVDNGSHSQMINLMTSSKVTNEYNEVYACIE